MRKRGIGKYIMLVVMVLLGLALYARADTYVNGYTRSNGTYVNSHYRSDYNSNKMDNWSTKGNYNPHNGLKGYRIFY